jgi:signal transduction histidine kinase/ligand-binding sensor domain-containing protein
MSLRPALGQSLGAVRPNQYVHQAWTIKDGAPPAVTALAQGPDGYLWLGTGSGLYRFDGVEFTRYAAPSGQHLVTTNLTALKFTVGGDLWIGSYDGGATRLRRGKLQSWGDTNGFPHGWVNNFAEGRDGDIWVATGRGLGRFDGKRWQTVGVDWDYPADRADWVHVDRDGTLWVTAVDHLFFLPPGAKRFKRSDIALGAYPLLAQDSQGTLWVSDRVHGTRPLPGLSVDHPNAHDPAIRPAADRHAAARMVFDDTGGLWQTALNNASVFHFSRPAEPISGAYTTDAALTDVFSAPSALTSNYALPVTLDNEGTIWVGTSLGIDSYHLSRVGSLHDTHTGTPAHLGITTDASGHLFLSTSDAVYQFDGNTFTPVLTTVPDTILSIFKDQSDTLWIIGFHDLMRDVQGHLEKVPLPEHIEASRLKFVAPGVRGDIWASVEGLGIYRFHGDTWSQWLPHTPKLELSPTAIKVEASGAIWFGYADGTLLRVDPTASEQVYRPQADKDTGPVTAISSGPFGVLFGGSAGLATVKNGHVESLTNQDFPAMTGITGILQQPDGGVWINAGRGVLQFTADELGEAFKDPGFRPATAIFDYRDGIEGSARAGQPVSTMQRSASGTIWLLTNENVYWIDPTTTPHNNVPPPVDIKFVVANDRRLAANQEIVLPAGTSALQVAYTALSLTSPTRVRFRYQLVGEDAGWISPGTRRRAYYTNLAPGTYRFNVTASNNENVWNTRGASLSITIPPRFYQAWWFHSLEVLFVIALIGLAYVLRVRKISQTIRLQTTARHEERERIARELHDTLLQAISGIVLKFQAIAKAIPDTDPLKKDIDGTLKMAADFIVEGRDRVKELRSRVSTTADLSAAILDLARALQDASSVVVDTSADITERPIDPGVADEILAICRESLINAVRHASASRIRIEVLSNDRLMQVRVIDNGQGIPPAILENATETGHWGIAGMRERALRIGTHLVIRSMPGETIVELRAPLRQTLASP